MVLQSIELPSVCLNVLENNDKLLCSLANRCILKFHINNLEIEPDPLKDGIVFSQSLDTETHLVYNRYAKKYYYGLSDCKEISVLSFNEEGEMLPTKKIELKKKPQVLDVLGNTIAYLHRE